MFVTTSSGKLVAFPLLINVLSSSSAVNPVFSAAAARIWSIFQTCILLVVALWKVMLQQCQEALCFLFTAMGMQFMCRKEKPGILMGHLTLTLGLKWKGHFLLWVDYFVAANVSCSSNLWQEYNIGDWAAFVVQVYGVQCVHLVRSKCKSCIPHCTAGKWDVSLIISQLCFGEVDYAQK